MILRLTLILLGMFPAGSLQAAKASPGNLVEWRMLPVNEGQLQADSHLLRFPSGELYLIDVAYGAPDIVPYLQQHGIRSVDAVILSHMHKDHYGGLLPIIESGVKVKKVYFNVPPKTVCDKEIPWGCDYADIEKVRAFLKKHRIATRTMRAGDALYTDGRGTSLKVLYAYDGVNTPVGATDVNDTSVILKLRVGKMSALFTGDLNKTLGTHLASKGAELGSHILKVPHHGTEGVAPDAFFDSVGAKVILVPSPRDLWKSSRSERIRKYFESKPVTTYVSGFDGEVVVRLSKSSIEVEKTRAQPAQSWPNGKPLH